MKIIVVGCGRVGAELAHRLYQKGHQVTVIDQSDKSFNNLPPDFRGRTVEGEATNQHVLERAGIAEAEGLVAVTNLDPINAVVAHLARSFYGIENVIARNYDPTLRPLLEAFNLQLISSSSWGAQRLEELIVHAEMRAVFSSGNGEVEIYEFAIDGTWDGCTLAELIPPEGCSPASLTRAGKAILPGGDTVLHTNDILLVSATFEGIEEVRRKLHTGPEV